MALSGTLDSFALPDVMRLLASSKKTGRLRVTGDRGSGSIWVDGGEIVSTELASAASIDSTHSEVLFGLLRFGSGSFTFEVDARGENGSAPDEVEPILTAAEEMLIEWRAVEEIVPSLDVLVTLAPEPTRGDVMIDAPRWRCIAAVASGATAESVGISLGQGELEVCRTIKELVELGLLEIGDVPSEPSDVAPHVDADQVEQVEQVEQAVQSEPDAASFDDELAESLAEELGGELQHGPGVELGVDPVENSVGIGGSGSPADELDDSLADVGIVSGSFDDDPSGDLDDGDLDHGLDPIVATAPGLAGLTPENEPAIHPRSLLDEQPELGSGPEADMSAGADAGLYDADPGQNTAPGIFGAAPVDDSATADLDPAEMARQLANLSPKAAKAVAAAAKASTDAERDEALAAVEAEDDTVNRGLLLKFLGSVET